MDYKFTFQDGSEAIAHYGVKGMKWGIWNFDTRRKYEGLGKIEGAAGGGGWVEEEDEDSENSEETEEQPKTVGEMFLRNLFYNPLEENAKFREAHPEAFPYKEQPMTADEDMAAVNPPYDALKAEYNIRKFFANEATKKLVAPYGEEITNVFDLKLDKAGTNCAACSVVYDLRRRGYNVDAKMTRNLSSITSNIHQYYKDAFFKSCDTKNTLEDDFKRMPNGSRGVLCGTTKYGGGHAISWEKESNKVVYRDCQSGTIVKDVYDIFCDRNNYSSAAVKRTGTADNLRLQYVRLDDKEPNLKVFYNNGITTPSRKTANKSTNNQKTNNPFERVATVARQVKKVSEAKKRIQRLFG